MRSWWMLVLLVGAALATIFLWVGFFLVVLLLGGVEVWLFWRQVLGPYLRRRRARRATQADGRV